MRTYKNYTQEATPLKSNHNLLDEKAGSVENTGDMGHGGNSSKE